MRGHRRPQGRTRPQGVGSGYPLPSSVLTGANLGRSAGAVGLEIEIRGGGI